MASGRPRHPNDPSVLSSVEAAVSTTVRPGILGLLWHWRYETAAGIGLPAAAVAIGYTIGIGWLIGAAATGVIILTAALFWPASRAWLIARAWCVVTPHRIRTGCQHAWVQTRYGRLPTVLHTKPTYFGERVLLWCRAGITSADLDAARDIISTACWAQDVRVITNERRRHLVTLEVIRRSPVRQLPDVTRAVPDERYWPYLANTETEGLDPEEPASAPRSEERPEEPLPLAG
jgi:hypothetical protein